MSASEQVRGASEWVGLNHAVRRIAAFAASADAECLVHQLVGRSIDFTSQAANFHPRTIWVSAVAPSTWL